MYDRAVRKLTEHDLTQAVIDQIPEGKQLDYKEALPGSTAREKKDFLADVSAFANTGGGLLLYGITEKRDDNGKATGLPASVPGVGVSNVDQETRRLDNMLLQGIKPRIQGIEFHAIELKNGNVVVALKVPRSWNPPHVVDHEGHWRFYARVAVGNMPMDLDEVRVSMTNSATLTHRLNHFRQVRIASVMGDELPVPIVAGPRLVLHMLPMTLGDPRYNLEMINIARQSDLFSSLLPLSGWGIGTRFNVDGLLVHAGSDEASYVQLFRTGAIEAVDGHMLSQKGANGNHFIPSIEFEHQLQNGVGRYLSFLDQVSITAPLALSLSMLNVRGVQLAQAHGSGQRTIDRDNLLLPEVLVEDRSVPPDVLLRPLLDMIWNACGFAHCQHYNAEGRWAPN